MINKLINLANTLDESGFKKEADRILSIIKESAGHDEEAKRVEQMPYPAGYGLSGDKGYREPYGEFEKDLRELVEGLGLITFEGDLKRIYNKLQEAVGDRGVARNFAMEIIFKIFDENEDESGTGSAYDKAEGIMLDLMTEGGFESNEEDSKETEEMTQDFYGDWSKQLPQLASDLFEKDQGEAKQILNDYTSDGKLTGEEVLNIGREMEQAQVERQPYPIQQTFDWG